MAALHRKDFLRSSLALAGFPLLRFGTSSTAGETVEANNRFKISLNAYSFNAPLTGGKTDLFKVMEFAAQSGFDAVDLTGYYFTGYPEVPADEYIYRLKKRAHELGLAISGT